MLRTVLTSLLSPMGIAGTLMVLGPGLGLVAPMDDARDKAIIAAWSAAAGVQLPPALFFGCMGTCKVLGVLALWGAFGRKLDAVANLCFIPQLLGAVYTHHALGETVRICFSMSLWG